MALYRVPSKYISELVDGAEVLLVPPFAIEIGVERAILGDTEPTTVNAEHESPVPHDADDVATLCNAPVPTP